MGVLLLRQTCSILSTYAADVSGVCSALYEMGGMTVMHDASGCNSTYNTHDEPRWYSTPSMVYLSALYETEAMLGDESRIINDICTAAAELSPRFIAIAGTPIPMMMGTDFRGLAMEIEERSGIPTFGFATNGMHSYTSGADMSMAAVARRFCPPDVPKRRIAAGEKARVNLLGVTPLDFSVTGNVEAIKKLFEDNGYHIQSCWAMGSSWDELMSAGGADVSVVLSSAGMSLAKVFEEIYGMPYVVGVPVGEKLSELIFKLIDTASETGENSHIPNRNRKYSAAEKPVCVIGEQVCADSIANALRLDFGYSCVKVLAPLDFPDEDKIFSELSNASIVIADPLYKPAVPKDGSCHFIPFPHEGYSGRIWRKDIPIFVGTDFDKWIESETSK